MKKKKISKKQKTSQNLPLPLKPPKQNENLKKKKEKEYFWDLPEFPVDKAVHICRNKSILVTAGLMDVLSLFLQIFVRKISVQIVSVVQ